MHLFPSRRLLPVVAAGALALSSVGLVAAAGNGAGGVTGPAFYVDGTLYRTVGTPTDLSGTGAPADSFDTIYALPDQTNVAEAAPGDTDFNGGRWQVQLITFADYSAAVATYDANGSGDFDSAEEVEAAIAGGAGVDNGVVAQFECPVIPLPRGQR